MCATFVSVLQEGIRILGVEIIEKANVVLTNEPSLQPWKRKSFIMSSGKPASDINHGDILAVKGPVKGKQPIV